MASKRKLYIQSAVALGLFLVTIFVTGGVIGYLSASDEDVLANPVALAIIGVFAVISMVIAMWISLKWMRSIDEAAQEAHKWAWFWGGSSGMAVGGVFVILASLPQAAAINIPAWYSERSDPAAYAATGAFAMLTLMLIGYGVAWAWWWLGRR
ncbi:hypothetical protein [Brevundimonas sp.]|uniref:hypothetical protein n=1 Tax=Brevundimonas sp. TaxID=1871086 RepID=UPI0028A9343E|nr:hypothetical protein [Brevundimonas sp.]